MTAILAELVRGPLVENIYRGDIAVVDGAGRVIASVGDVEKVTFWRSSAKPIQALPLLVEGAADAFGFTDTHLAIFSSSHNAEPAHQEAVRDALAKAGLDASHLKCGPHPPYDRETAKEMASRGEAPTVIHSNCSGKHTGMVALAQHMGYPLADYLEPQSQVQQLILRYVARAVDLAPEQVAIGVDGCGVPVFGMPIRNMALSFARLAEPELMPDTTLAGAARRMREALVNQPYLVAGRGRLCTDLMGLPGRRFVAKSGADGVYCVGVLPEAVAQSPILREMGVTGAIGIAVKAEDGHTIARHMATVEALRQLGLMTPSDLEALAAYSPTVVMNHAGTTVGEWRSAFSFVSI